MGPLVSEAQRERVERLPRARARARRDRDRRQGARAGDGFFLEPTVVAGLEQGDEMIQREIFGPVVTVQRFTTRTRRSSGRTASTTASPSSVWTRDVGRAMDAARAAALRNACG